MPTLSPITGFLNWYVAGQFYVDANGNAFDVGYFTHIQGIDQALFQNPDQGPSPGTAHFTFSAIDDPFVGSSFYSGSLKMTSYPSGTWKMYLKKVPGANYDSPISFSTDSDGKSPKDSDDIQWIATFKRPANMTGVNSGATTNSILSFELIDSQVFTFGEGKNQQEYDPKELFGSGVTQSAIGSTTLLPPLPEYPTISAFFASAVQNG